jgi:phosphate transport system protein
VQETPTHFETSVERDLARIRGKVAAMADLAEKALLACVRSLAEGNRQLAYAVVLRDQYIDELEKEVDRLCLEFIVRQQPAAGLLRFAYATIKINLELERVGDYAESIARQILKLEPFQTHIPIERLQAMADLSIPMLRDAVRAFLSQDAELAKKTIEAEEAVDGLKSSLNRDLVRSYRESALPFEALNPLMMITRRLERVSDQARNICMEVLYMCTGEYAKHPGAETFRILFADETNACGSQMAEAIGHALAQPRFHFASAGLEPGPIAAATAAFLREKGLDPAGLAPKAIAQVPHLDQYQVIVILAPPARRAFPQTPRKVVVLDWNLKDPGAARGSPAEVRAAYESAYQFLHDHVQDLVAALLGVDNNQPQHTANEKE